jgi:hypothetical protein
MKNILFALISFFFLIGCSKTPNSLNSSNTSMITMDIVGIQYFGQWSILTISVTNNSGFQQTIGTIKYIGNNQLIFPDRVFHPYGDSTAFWNYCKRFQIANGTRIHAEYDHGSSQNSIDHIYNSDTIAKESLDWQPFN